MPHQPAAEAAALHAGIDKKSPYAGGFARRIEQGIRAALRPVAAEQVRRLLQPPQATALPASSITK
jgi:hypothetical protein